MGTNKKQNPYTKRNVIQVRVDNEDLKEIFTKAQMFSKGNISDFAREAMLKYKPLKRGK